MKRLLIILGLVIIPFYEIFLHALPFAVCHAPDTRVTKELIALVFALSIGLLAVFEGNIKQFRNKFLLIIPVYLLFNLIMSPHAPLFINNNEVGDFYFWKPFAEILCFALMIVAVASMEIDLEEIFKVMVWCATIMAVYMILQRFGLDQFFKEKQGQEFIQVHGRDIGGNLGQPTLASSFIVMMIPLAIYLRRYWSIAVIVIAALFTQGAMVLMALFLIGAILLIRFNSVFIWIFLSILLAVGFYISIDSSIRAKAIDRMDGRYGTWQKIVEDIHDGQINSGDKFAITGIGLGRFSFIFPAKHNSPFQQVHNDTLEFIYDCGLVGGFLLLAGFFMMFNVNLTRQVFPIALSLITIFFLSMGTFVFQLGAHQFYSAILVGLINNDSILRRT